MTDVRGSRRRATGPRSRRRAADQALAAHARARLERVLPPAQARPAGAAVPIGERAVPAGPSPSAGTAPADGPSNPPADDEPVPPAAVESAPPPRLSRPAVLGVVLVCLVGLVAAAMHLLRARPAEVAVPTPTRSVAPSVSKAATVVVDVAGAVRRPGVYPLPGGSRVAAALARAGGALPGADTSSLNLARLLVDGEQVLVPLPGQSGPPVGGGGGPSPGGAGALVDLNTATLDQLEALPGVGPVLAQRILDWRTEHGRFSSVDELGEVSGVGERKLAELTPLVRV